MMEKAYHIFNLEDWLGTVKLINIGKIKSI